MRESRARKRPLTDDAIEDHPHGTAYHDTLEQLCACPRRAIDERVIGDPPPTGSLAGGTGTVWLVFMHFAGNFQDQRSLSQRTASVAAAGRGNRRYAAGSRPRAAAFNTHRGDSTVPAEARDPASGDAIADSTGFQPGDVRAD